MLAPRPRPVPGIHRKILNIALAAVFIAIGLVGLILPVIPGVAFLALALVVLARTSTRIRRLTADLPYIQRVERRIDAADRLSALGKVKYFGLMFVAVMLECAATIARAVRGARSR